MMESLPNGRITANGNIKDVRADHVARYHWAGEALSGHVIDAGCNCGYGSAMLADAGLTVTAIDIWLGGLDYAHEHYDRAAITWIEGDLLKPELPIADAVVAFEVIEHLADPVPLLKAARGCARTLLASVPNQDVWPWQERLAPVHHRHYTRSEFDKLLRQCGWHPKNWFGQLGPNSDVEPLVKGRTIVVECA